LVATDAQPNQAGTLGESLRLEAVVAGYHGSEVLHRVNLYVPAGQAVVLLGPNGAGKSTTMKVISGLLRQRSGRVLLGERDVSSLPAHERARIGICLVPEGRRIFQRQTVEENLLIGSYACMRDKAWRDEAFRWVFDLFPVLERKRGKVASTLSGGEQQMLAVAQAVMAKPRVLLLDEPSAGLAPALVKQLLERVQQLHARGISVLMVEQVVASALSIADYVYVMRDGQIVASGTAEEMRGRDLESRYLGAEL
jgi:branched-chain amino acid transport system ATP-binding protein